jgi:hypothetical protein
MVRPKGTFDSSPAVSLLGRRVIWVVSPVGTTEVYSDAIFSRPYGTPSFSEGSLPSDRIAGLMSNAPEGQITLLGDQVFV